MTDGKKRLEEALGFGDVVTLDVMCVDCGETYRLKVLSGQLDSWGSGVAAQKAFPQLNSAERELLISQTCPACFDKLKEFSDEGGAGFDDEADGYAEDSVD